MTVQIKQQYALGFLDDLNELSAEALVVQGTVPNWLNGWLIKNGPAMFHVGGRQLAHWFDGFAKLHKFDIAGQQINYSCRFVQSQSYRAASRDGKLIRHEFASSPEFGLFDKLRALTAPSLTDNTNVNILRVADNWLALTETNCMMKFLPESLATVGPFKFDDSITAPITTAHPLFDPNTGAIFNLHVQLSLSNHYLISYLQPGRDLNKRRILTRIPVKRPAYIHSFAQSKRYIIVIESPLRLRTADLIFGLKPYFECYEWLKQTGTRFTIIDKEKGSYIVCECADRFFFHQVNAFDANDVVMLDLLTYPDATVLDSLRLANLHSQGSVQMPRLERFQINLTTKQVQVAQIGSCAIELPSINRHLANASPYQFVYGAGASSDNSFLDQVTKIDVESGSHTTWSRPESYYGEPLFVAHPDGTGEDNGVLLCLELNTVQKCSRLVIIDAHLMQLMAEANIPNMVPFGFHAVYTHRRN